jgi:hypothetical protein
MMKGRDWLWMEKREREDQEEGEGREKEKMKKMSNALGEGAVSTPSPMVGTTCSICKINGKKEEKWKY